MKGPAWVSLSWGPEIGRKRRGDSHLLRSFYAATNCYKLSDRRFWQGSPTYTTSYHISVGPRMLASVVWKWKAGAYPHQTGCSICRSSPPEAFDERRHALPHNAVECGHDGGNSLK